MRRHGGDNIEIILHGDSYSIAAEEAKRYAAAQDCIFIHPFDDLYTIAGQATIADEIVLSGDGPFDYAFIQVGGGGMAAGVATWLKMHYPDIKIIGVEGEDQACMKAAFDAGQPVTLDHVDTFCDGTAVKRAGDLSFQLCQQALDDIITVSNAEVSAGIERLWELKRVIPEPAGAMGLAGLTQYQATHEAALKGKKVVLIVCGANMDFSKLSLVAAQSAIGAQRRKHLRFHISEKSGSLLSLLETNFGDVNIAEFQYGKTGADEAWPVVAFEASPADIEALYQKLEQQNIPFEDVTSQPDIRYRVINYNPTLFKNPLLMHIHFPERQGALRDFLNSIAAVCNICYFNYANTGESIGRAIMGFEFEKLEDQETFRKIVEESVVTCRPVEEKTAQRILAG